MTILSNRFYHLNLLNKTSENRRRIETKIIERQRERNIIFHLFYFLSVLSKSYVEGSKRVDPPIKQINVP